MAPMAGPVPREEDIDAILASWDERLRRVDENLIALEADPTYQMLGGGGSGPTARLTGTTHERVTPALAALGELFEQREQLSALVARAKALRGDVSFWNKDDKLAEIAALLTGPSIVLGTKQLPIAQRNLLDSATADVAIGPEQLLAQMVRGFQVARDAVGAVGGAWAELEPRLGELERSVARIEAEAGALDPSLAAGPTLARIKEELERVRGRVATDPLGVQGEVDAAVAAPLAELRAALDDALSHKASLARGFEEADALVLKIEAATRDAGAALARAEREIDGFQAAATAEARKGREEIAQGLPAWREKIASAAAAGHHRSADVGLARWLEVARGLLEQEVGVARAARAAEEQRTELEGRLSARRAQVAALAQRGVAAPPEVEALARTAERTLRARPTDLALALRQVDAHDAAVRALSSRR